MGLNVLLTGAAGFIGSHVAERLVAEGHVVTGVDCLDARVHPLGLPPEWLPSSMQLVTTEVGNTPYWAMAERDTVIHLAAQVGVADSMSDPMRYVDGNTRQTAAFLNDLMACADRRSLKRLIVASSMSVYGAGGALVEEDAPCVPASVYGLTKYDQERLCRMWGAQHGVEVVALRFFNVYGPRQALTNPYTGVLANFANAIRWGETPVVYEDGGQTRDFIYVADVADAVIRAATLPSPVAGVYNVCTGKPTTILCAARTLAAALGHPEIEPRITNTARPGDIRHCTGNPKAIKDSLFWEAEWSFRDGITAYGQWILEQRGVA